MQLSTPIEQITRVGPIYQKRLKKLGIKTVGDLLLHLPHRYEDFSNISPIAKVKINETCCLQGKILEIKTIRTFRKRMSITEAVITDATGAVKAVWFNQPYLVNVLKPKDNICLVGKIVSDKYGLCLSNPAYEKLGEGELTHTGRIISIYPETSGLSSRWLRYVIKQVLINSLNETKEILPDKVIKEHRLLPLKNALWQVHFPDSMSLAQKARERFSFEGLFVLSLWILMERNKISSKKAFAVPLNLALVQRFVKSLPFKLTDAQKKATWQILKDIEKPRPMNRLLEGDVGSGKTVVATIAALNLMRAGYQTVIMAPTEILAKQHFKTVSKLLEGFKLDVGLLTGKEDKFVSKKLNNDTIEISRKKLLEKALHNEINILIGTHALIQDQVKFEKLGLVILDEQHRFGVEQRAKLTKQETLPHLLSMTATPIPRTLALTIYGDLDLSLIKELPKGRKKVITKVVPPIDRNKTYSFIKKEVRKGRQVFVICPRIEAKRSDLDGKKVGPQSWSEVKAVKEEYEKLSKKVFPDLRVGILHGKLAMKEKERTMRDFHNKKTDILVSTSVVEVGVDIPNASVMLIEGAERFGLAQLHQFRGRVGRSKYQSYCFLFTDSPSRKTNQRLKALITCDNGFELAEKDLQIRGPGDFSGQRQWGIPDIAMASLKDMSLIEKTRTAAKQLLEEDPKLKKYPALQDKLKVFQERIHLE
ncbi:MAG: ATP-dependent DNA helicase RecG [Candidatus Nealsonbacteria bacterium]|nr:ATP-dependent DNA helicase RecG [Candidatus Nealsonbacteria bacterium]